MSHEKKEVPSGFLRAVWDEHLEPGAESNSDPRVPLRDGGIATSQKYPPDPTTVSSGLDSPVALHEAIAFRTKQGTANLSSWSGTYYTCISSPSDAHEQKEPSISSRLRPIQNQEYAEALRKRSLLLPVDEELNWSGREPGMGQHAEFDIKDEVPLEYCGQIGASSTSRVDKVRCRRIFLARKSMVCSRRLTLDEAMGELVHLQELQHPHIVQLVGSYVHGRIFAFLLYPVADYHLADFIRRGEQILASKSTEYDDFMALKSLGRFFSCLTRALEYVHDHTIKHMDIKPQNILVKRSPQYVDGYQVYLADFGVSRSFADMEQSQTDGRTALSPKYCAPEVYNQEMRGRSADIFSLGCVFVEMLTVLCRRRLHELTDHLCDEYGEHSFHSNTPKAIEWLDSLRHLRPSSWISVLPNLQSIYSRRFFWHWYHNMIISRIVSMLDTNPNERPPALCLAREVSNTLKCCQSEREQLVAEDGVSLSFGREAWISTLDDNEFLMHAILSGRSEVLQNLLNLGLDPNAKIYSLSILQIPVGNEDYESVKLLLEKGAAVDPDAFVIAAGISVSMVNLLLQFEPVIEESVKHRMQQMAASSGCEEVSQLLLDRDSVSVPSSIDE
jgi:serine/threonine protein kinase